jgi:cyclophilin family peptidyl-prolyl cis-trans isomerase
LRTAGLLTVLLTAFLLPACSLEKDTRPKDTAGEEAEEEPAGPHPMVVIDTSFGPIKAELYEKKSPITVKNFLAYVDDKFYDGTLFHRVMPNFMIQGGGFLPGMKEKETRAEIKNESLNGLKNLRGTLAMARRPDPDSASAQFFINLKHNRNLDPPGGGRPAYAVFGKVVDGMDVVDRIAQVKTEDVGGHEAVPVRDVLIKSIRRVDAK